MRHHRSRGRSGHSRRKLEWYWGSFQSGSTFLTTTNGNSALYAFWFKAPSGVVDNVSEAFPIVAEEDETLVRCRVSIGVGLQANTGGNSWGNGYISAGLIRWDATTDSSPADLPAPFEDGAGDWIWRWILPVGALPGSTGGAIRTDGNLTMDSQVDVRAMRKLSANQGILGVYEVSSVDFPAGINSTFAWDARMLVKKP